MRVYIIFILIISSCSIQQNTGYNHSELSIKNETKSYTVLGNLRVVIAPGEYKYDKIMMAAIEQYGDGVDIINVKFDTHANGMNQAGITMGTHMSIANCLVIKYD
jgi:hypothetical protein